MSLYLLVFENDQLQRSHLIEGERLEIGRAEGSEIHFDLPEVSRNHARLILKPGTLLGQPSEDGVADLIDAGSRYGVWIADNQVWYSSLHMGEQFRISESLSLCLSYHSEQIILQPHSNVVGETDLLVSTDSHNTEEHEVDFVSPVDSESLINQHSKLILTESPEVSEVAKSEEMPLDQNTISNHLDEAQSVAEDEVSVEVVSEDEVSVEVVSEDEVSVEVVSEDEVSVGVVPDGEMSGSSEHPNDSLQLKEPSVIQDNDQIEQFSIDTSTGEDQTAIEDLISTTEDHSAGDMTAVDNRQAMKAAAPVEYIKENESNETVDITDLLKINLIKSEHSQSSVKTLETPDLNEPSSLCKPDLSEICSTQLIHIRRQLNIIQEQLPSGIDLHVQLTQTVNQLDNLVVYLDQTSIPFSEAIITIRQAVAPLTPADFAFHINDQTGDLHVTQAFIEAFKVAFLALVSADEYDWLHIDFLNQNGRLQVSSDPPLKSYLDPSKYWTHKVALDLLGLS